MELKIKVPEKLARQINDEIQGIETVKVESSSIKPSEGGSQFEPFTEIVIVLIGYAIISRILDLIIDQKYPGAIVYLDKLGNLSVEQSPGIANGSLLFVSPDGKKEMFNRVDIGNGLLQAAIARFSPTAG